MGSSVSLLVLALASSIQGQDVPAAQWPIDTRRFQTEGVSPTGLDVDAEGKLVTTVAGTLQQVPLVGGTAEQIRTGSDYVVEPQVSPDGRRLAYLSNARPGAPPSDDFSLWVSDRDGSNAAQLLATPLRSLTWSSDSGRLFGIPVPSERGDWAFPYGHVIAVTLEGQASDLGIMASGGVHCCLDGRLLTADNNVLRTVDLQTGETAVLLEGGGSELVRPISSRDGRTVAFAELTDGRTILTRLDLGTLQTTPIESWLSQSDYDQFDYSYLVGPVAAFDFDPQGRGLIFANSGMLWRDDGDVAAAISAVFDVEREFRRPFHPAPRPITDTLSIGQLRWPTWSADGQELVVSAGGHLWRVSSGEPPERLNRSDSLEYFPSFSADRSHLVYIAMVDQGCELRLKEWATGYETVLAREPVIARPTFSPDGRRLAYYSAETPLGPSPVARDDGTLLLRVIDLESLEATTVKKLNWPELSFSQYYPPLTWSADGRLNVQVDLYPEQTEEKAYALLSVDPLRGETIVRHESRFGTDFLIVSPSGRLLAKQERRTLSIIDLDNGRELSRIENVGAQFLEWSGDEIVRFTSGNMERALQVGASDLASERRISIEVDRARADGVYAFVDLTVISMGPAGDLDHATVIIEDGRISAVGVAGDVTIPPNATVVWATGKFMMPGIIDTHTHIHYPTNGDPDLQARTRWQYTGSLAFGVTTLFDPASMSTYALSSADLVEAGEAIGPRVFSTGWTILGDRTHIFQTWIDDEEDVHAIARIWKEQGAFFLKSYFLPRDQRRWLVEAGAEVGLPVTVDGMYFTSKPGATANLFEDGMSSFEHMPQSDIQDEIRRFEASSGVWITPTMMTNRQAPLLRQTYNGRFVGDERTARFMPTLVRERLGRTEDVPVWNRYSPWLAAENVAELDRLGALISVGAHGTPIDTHLEIWGLARGGLSADHVLRAATINGAIKLGLQDELGTVEVGKLADLLILARDPRVDVTATQDLEIVVARGQPYEAGTLEPIN